MSARLKINVGGCPTKFCFLIGQFPGLGDIPTVGRVAKNRVISRQEAYFIIYLGQYICHLSGFGIELMQISSRVEWHKKFFKKSWFDDKSGGSSVRLSQAVYRQSVGLRQTAWDRGYHGHIL
jgi:hypothetical protein